MSSQVVSRMPAMVVRHLVVDGDPVTAGQAVVVTETMKCEQTLVAEAAGVVSLRSKVGDVVEPGQPVAVVSPAGDSSPRGKRPRPPRPLEPAQVVAKVCGPTADPELGPAARTGTFVQHTLVSSGEVFATPAPGDRLVAGAPEPDAGCGVVVGVMTHVLDGHPQGVSRVWIGGDPSRSMGAVSEAECRHVIAAFDLAERLGVPVEWVAVSAGARIAWDTGTETMDWCAAVVARIVRFTQAGGQVVVVVNGINVGAQSYWNAEATMLNHHKGMLVMVGDQAMVLTGHRALALSGGGTHRDDAHIGGYDEVMGPNGQAHHVAPDVVAAYRLVLAHHSLCTPRRDEEAPVVTTADPLDRDVSVDPYPGPEPFGTVGEVLHSDDNPGRKQAFAIHPVMGALVDRDAPVLERWTDMADARGVVVWDSRVGGTPTTVIGIEGRPHRADTGNHWLAGATLHPEGSRKAARAINAASGNRPVVVLASLAGFDGSQRSMRGRQLEFGAEIARAVTNFDGAITVVVLGRFHGGAYVVFSKALNPRLRIVAVDGSYVSVIGGDSAAGVVFAGELRRRVTAELARTPGADADEVLRRERDALARRFDEVHDVRRAAAVGSVDEVVPPSLLRPTVARLIGAAPAVPEQGAAAVVEPQPASAARRAAASASAAVR